MRHLYISLFVLVFLAQVLDTYANTTKELQQALRNAQSDTTRMRLYLQLSNEHMEDVNLLVGYADSAVMIAQAGKDSAFMIKVYTSLSRNFIFLADFNNAHYYIDLAKRNLPVEARGTETEADVLIVLGDVQNRLNQYQKAIDNYQKARKIGKKLRDKELQAQIDNNIGVAYWHTGNLDSALDAYLRAVKYFEQNHDTIAACLTYANIAAIYDDWDRPTRQLHYLNKAARMAKSSDNLWLKSWSYKEMGAYYLAENDTLQARKYYDKLLDIIDQSDNKLQVSESYIELARFYNKLGQRSKSFQYHYKALTVNQSEAETNTQQAVAVHHALAELYQAELLSDSALYHAEKAFDIAFESGDNQTLAVVSQMLSKHYQQKGNINKAIDYGIKAYDNASGFNPVLARDVANLLGILYESVGKSAEANYYMKTYYSLADSLRNSEDKRKTRIWSSNMEHKQREAELNSQIAYQEQRLRINRTLVTLLISVLVMAVAIAVLSRQNATARKQSNIKLASQKEELEVLNNELNNTSQELQRYQERLEQLVDDKTAALQKALVKAQESDMFKAAFFANMSHEIRTPLNAILGFLQFIDDTSLSPKRREEMMDQIHISARQLLSMVGDIVSLSMIDSGLLIIHPKETVINELLDAVMAESQQILQYTTNSSKLSLVLENRLPEDRQIFTIDAKLMEQVLMQLISNAIKFTPWGFIQFGCEMGPDQTALEFFVNDSGIGISEKDVKLIFNRFWKPGDLHTQSYRGLGIGLSLCEELVHLMGGNITVSSVLGSGSSFRVTIPLTGI